MMTSRKCCLGILSILIIAIFGSAFAESAQTYALPECRAIAILSFSNGKAHAVGGSMMIPSGYTVATTAVLQEKRDTAWVGVTSSTGSKEACASAVAVQGVTYRSFVTCKLYDSTGKYMDSISATSESKTY